MALPLNFEWKRAQGLHLKIEYDGNTAHCNPSQTTKQKERYTYYDAGGDPAEYVAPHKQPEEARHSIAVKQPNDANPYPKSNCCNGNENRGG